MERIKEKLTSAAPGALFWLFVIQPVLDVASYWANRLSVTAVTTGLRFVMFVAVALFSFVISNRKKRCLALYAFIAVFFALHAISCCLEGGYRFVSDAANFLRIVQLPVFTMCFIDVFKAAPEAKKRIPKAFFAILCVILCVVALSFVVGKPVFTYTEVFEDGAKGYYGFRGWFETGNAQSAIVVIIVPFILLFAYEKKNEPVFALVAAVSLANLYFFGTRFAFYSIFIICAGMIISLMINGQKRIVVYAVLALISAAALICLKSSFMHLHQNNYRSIMTERQEDTNSKIEKIKEKYHVTLDANALFSDGDEPEPTVPETEQTAETGETTDDPGNNPLLNKVLREAENELRSVYIEEYKKYCSDMVERFGINRVAQIYNTTNSSFTLSNQRLKKINFAHLSWEDSSIPCRLFGFQYSTLVTYTTSETGKEEIKEIYDLENDFSGTFYFVGWLGMIPYLAFIAYFLIRALVFVIRGRKWPSVELLVALMTLVLLLLAAQFSGNVLRRPNVSIYLSAVLAYIHCITGRIFDPRAEKDITDEAEHNNPGL